VRRSLAILGTFATGLLLLMQEPAWAQQRALVIEDVNDDEYPYVEVTVTVPEVLGDARLPKEAFAVTENGEARPRPSQGNAPAEEQAAPRAVLAIDVSGSMRDTIDRAKDAAAKFVASLPQESEVAIVTFGDEVEVPLDFTTDLELARLAIRAVDVSDPQAETALYDGVQRAAELLPVSDGVTSSIVVLSDGDDTISDASERQAIRTLQNSDATVWVVGIESGDFDPEALDALTGEDGRLLSAGNADQLDGIYRDLASDLTRRYVLIYESTAAGDTDIGVTVDYRDEFAQVTTQADLSGERADSGATPVAPPDVFTVELPLLATTDAYVAGIAALSFGSLLIWLMILTPRPAGTRERLTSGTRQQTRPRLSMLAERATDIADRSLRDRKLGRRIDRQLESAGLDLRPGEVLLIIMSLMVVMFTVGVIAGSVLLGIVLATTPPLVWQLVLSIRRDRRHSRFSEQLPDILQLLTGSLRAGYGLVQAIDTIARDIDEPAKSEFRRILIEHRLGRDLNDAMDSCAERMDNADFSWVVQAIGIHRDVGGDLARVLDNIVATVRDRVDVHREVRSLSAEGRLSANVLTGLPILVLIAIQIMNPDYLSELFGQPIGWLLLATAAVLLLVGTLLIRRMVRIRY
jgi:tight adherence protein B